MWVGAAGLALYSSPLPQIVFAGASGWAFVLLAQFLGRLLPQIKSVQNPNMKAISLIKVRDRWSRELSP